MAMHFGLGLQVLHAIFLLGFLALHASSCEQEDYWQMKLPKVPMPQPIKDNLFHPNGWRYNSDDVKERVGVDQPFTDDAKKKIGVDQPYTVYSWRYNSDDSVKERVGVDQPFTDDAKKKIGVDQPYTVYSWRYNSDDSVKERVGVDQPFTDDAKKIGVDQPYTVYSWRYNSDDSVKERVGVDQPFTDDAKKKIGVDQPYTVYSWRYNPDDSVKERVGVDQPFTDDAKKKIGVDQPYTVYSWRYNSDDNVKERVGMDQPFTDDAKKAGLKQPYTIKGRKYNKDNSDKGKDNDDDVSSGSVFFIEKSLRLGEKLKHDFQKTRSVPFLPKHFVQSIPFSDDKFTKILDLFSIKPGSVEATGIKGTLDICLHRPRVEKENRTCAQSMEDVVDFVVRELGSNDVELRMMRNDIEVPKGIQDYVITKVKKLSVPSNTAAACHKMSYPYIVYYCHHQKDIGHYDVTLVSPTTNTAIQTTAVCHYDTYAWKPNVPALRYLGIRPGDAPVCHFSAINDMWWNLKPNSKSLDMVV